jgi:hypothetical protein
MSGCSKNNEDIVSASPLIANRFEISDPEKDLLGRAV